MPTAPPQLDIELLPTFMPRPNATHVVFDFDGTLSWIRHGWPEIMQQVIGPQLTLQPGETASDIRSHLFNEMYRFNGQPTLVFMAEMAKQITERGNTADPDELLNAFIAPLDAMADERHRQLREGETPPDELIVHGGRALIEHLHTHGLKTFILSGNPHAQINLEADLLDLTRYCAGRVQGHVHADNFSKQTVLEQWMAEDKFTGENLVMFGDGTAEIKATNNLHGLTIGVCTDEHTNGSGILDTNKKAVLLDANADALIADFRNPELLTDLILGL
ncbi:MAG: haloacid dehalogenase [Verrucomicrobiales bacterium]|nr:haloacid dehalogenase [Verrucomicrobiales bacterium]